MIRALLLRMLSWPSIFLHNSGLKGSGAGLGRPCRAKGTGMRLTRSCWILMRLHRAQAERRSQLQRMTAEAVPIQTGLGRSDVVRSDNLLH